MTRIVRCAAAAAFLSVGPLLHAQMHDGNFDKLPTGTAPDCAKAAGAWQFDGLFGGPPYCEVSATDYTIVETTSFDMGALGNSLHVAGTFDSDTTIHMANVMDAGIDEGVVVLADFDIWVAAESSGGTVYVGNGVSVVSQRGPQISWLSDGTMLQHGWNGNTVLGQYAFDTWQHVHLNIDMVAESYDVCWAIDGDDMQQIGDDLPFRVIHLEYIDRFTIAVFGATTPFVDMYFDDIDVRMVSDCVGDCNADGTINIFDFLCFQGLVTKGDPAADCNADGSINIFDFLCFQGLVTQGCD